MSGIGLDCQVLVLKLYVLDSNAGSKSSYLDSLSCWSEEWLLVFQPRVKEKCKVMRKNAYKTSYTIIWDWKKFVHKMLVKKRTCDYYKLSSIVEF